MPPIPTAAAGTAAGTTPGPLPDGIGLPAIPGDDGETTRPFSLPNSAVLVDEIVELVAAEGEALLSGGEDADERLADLNLRLSLIAWDILEDEEDSARYLELAERHPLAVRLTLSHALLHDDVVTIERTEGLVEHVADARERLVLLRDLAEAWLYRVGDPGRAAATATRGVEAG
ncbi:MAG: hypothetical protein H6709_24945, partial [Kofleriaceae bacterium]|nr:hypothetical protein [Kofleriaceae bacterium]